MPAATSPATPASSADFPGVSVVMPVLNEEHHLETAVDHVLTQDYPGDLELVMALGPSHDRTGQVAADIVASDARIRSVINATGATGSGLNLAIRAARHDIIVRVDGHAMLPRDYVRVAVETLQRT